jgi:formiminotetrahydrofolate cyclodeaminase
MYNRIFSIVKKLIPRISDTELIALRSGTTSLDRQIFNGNVNIKINFKSIQTNKFDENKIYELISKYKNDTVYPNTNNNEIINFLGKNKFFSFIIDEKYGGTNLSVK